MLQERVFDADAVAINFAEGPPSGPPLVLIHGGGDRWQYFWPIIPNLSARWQVYALDLRGHRKSDRVPGEYRPEHYVGDVTAFLEARLTEPAILFGHSLGGWIALLSAAQQAHKVRALILGDPPLDMERFVATESSEQRVSMWRRMRTLADAGLSVPELASELAKLPVELPGRDQPMQLGDLPGMDAAYLRAWAKSLHQVDPDVAQYHAERRIDEYVEHIDLNAALQQIACPVLLLQGDPAMGGVVSDRDVESTLSLLSDGLHIRIEGAGHDLGLAAWDVAPLLRAVTNFVESL